MPFDPAAFGAGLSQPDRRREGAFNPTEFMGDLSGTIPRTHQREATAENIAGTAATGAVGAAATAYGFSGPAVGPRQAYQAVGQPLLESAGRLGREYIANPLRGATAAAATKVAPGAIPAQVARGAMPDIRANITSMLGQLPRGTDVAADQFLRGLQPQDVQRLDQDIRTKGLDRAFREFQAPQYLDDAGRQALQQVQGSFPTGMQRLGRAANLVGRTAARFAGPVGLAATAYDVYEMGSDLYDRYQRSQQNLDQQIREEAARRALQGAP